MQSGDLLIHPGTKKNIELFIKKPAHALLLTGPSGSGKETIARLISAELLKLAGAQKIDSYPYFMRLSVPEGKQDIPIEEVRRVIRLQGLKVPGRNEIKRIILFENATQLSIPAQNALLKILEEPSLDTVFILSAVSSEGLLPTIASRAQKIFVQPVSLTTVKKQLASTYSEAAINSAWQLSLGRAGLLIALLQNKQTHPLKIAIDDAKSFLRSSSYERLIAALEFSQDSDSFRVFLEALERTLAALHRNALRDGRTSQAARLLSARRLTKNSSQAINNNANAKLIALELVLNMTI